MEKETRRRIAALCSHNLGAIPRRCLDLLLDVDVADAWFADPLLEYEILAMALRILGLDLTRAVSGIRVDGVFRNAKPLGPYVGIEVHACCQEVNFRH